MTIHDVFWAFGAVAFVGTAVIGLWFAVIGAVHQLTRRH